MRLIRTRAAILAALCAAGTPALAQKPAIGAVVNAATYTVPTYPLGGLAPNSLASVFGQRLSAVTTSALTLPLPNILGGTTVVVNGVAAPLLYVSPTQINFQVPTAAFQVYSASAPVVVQTASGESDPFTVSIGTDIGIFTTDASACGRGAVFNVAADGSVSLNSPANSIPPGGIVTVWGTGFGVVPGTPPDGEPSPLSPLARDQAVQYLLPILSPGSDTTVFTSLLFAGKAPGLVGVDQFNIDLPENAPEGCSVPLVLLAPTLGWTSTSQPVPVSIHRGGGQCVDPAQDSIALLTWKKTVVAGTPGSTDSLSIEFKSRIGLTAPTPLAEAGTCLEAVLTPPPGPQCSWAQDRHLDAGLLTVRGPGFRPVEVAPDTSGGQLLYALTIPAGTLRPGAYTIAAVGGRDVGAFVTSIMAPEPVQVTSTFSGTMPNDTHDVVANWTGGDPGSVIRLDADVVPSFSAARYTFECASVPSAGTITLPWYGVPHGPGKIAVTQTLSQTFSAPGLTLGGRHTWIYEFKFTGLTF